MSEREAAVCASGLSFEKSENMCCSCKIVSDVVRFMADHAISAKWVNEFFLYL